MREKEPLVNSLHTGRDLIGAQNLLKKHQALMSEITGHEQQINNVCQSGTDMVDERKLMNKFFSTVPMMITLNLGLWCCIKHLFAW